MDEKYASNEMMQMKQISDKWHNKSKHYEIENIYLHFVKMLISCI